MPLLFVLAHSLASPVTPIASLFVLLPHFASKYHLPCVNPNVDEPPKATVEVPPVTDSPKRFPSAKVGALLVGTFKGFNVAKLLVQVSVD